MFFQNKTQNPFLIYKHKHNLSCMSVSQTLTSVEIDHAAAQWDLYDREWWHDRLPRNAAWKMRKDKLDLWDVPGIKNTKRYGMTRDEVQQFMTNLTRETAYQIWEECVVMGETEMESAWYWFEAERALFTDGS